MPKKTALTSALIQRVCERVANGEMISDIAKSEGAHRNTLFAWIRDNPEFERTYAQARVVSVELMLEGAEAEINKSKSRLDIKRTELKLNQARWKAEKLLPHFRNRTESTVINATPSVVGWLDSEPLLEAVRKLASALEALGGDPELLAEARQLTGEGPSIN